MISVLSVNQPLNMDERDWHQPRQNSTKLENVYGVSPMKYEHGLNWVVFHQWLILPKSFRIFTGTWQSYNCPNTSEVTLWYVGKYITLFHNNYWYKQNKVQKILYILYEIGNNCWDVLWKRMVNVMLSEGVTVMASVAEGKRWELGRWLCILGRNSSDVVNLKWRESLVDFTNANKLRGHCNTRLKYWKL